MAFTAEDIRANREYFAAKLKAERQMNDVARWSEGSPLGRLLLLDVRGGTRSRRRTSRALSASRPTSSTHSPRSS